MTTVSWEKPGKAVAVSVDGRTFNLQVGDCITFARCPLGARIDEFSGTDPAGPMGMVYLPWLGDKFADYAFTLRGNPYFIICPPVGMDHYGQHIDWATVEIVNSF